MKSHKHKYITRDSGKECSVCGLLQATIEMMEGTKPTAWTHGGKSKKQWFAFARKEIAAWEKFIKKLENKI